MQKNSLNKVILIGNLGQDPEARFTPQGTAVTNLSIATNESWKDQSGEMQDRTEWHRVVMYGRMAETATEYMKKGQMVYVEGRLHTREWEDQNQIKRTKINYQYFGLSPPSKILRLLFRAKRGENVF